MREWREKRPTFPDRPRAAVGNPMDQAAVVGLTSETTRMKATLAGVVAAQRFVCDESPRSEGLLA
jgi:hypothetical protein